MSIQAAPRRWTYAEFARLPDDGNRYEIIDGDLYVTPAPRPLHQEIAARISDVVRAFVRKHRLGRGVPGPVDVLFAEGDYLEPDFVFVAAGREAIWTDRGIEGAPDLVVEVLSPATAARDRGVKRLRYMHFGVREYWVVDPEAGRIEVYRSDDPASIQIAADELEWRPVEDGPALTVDVRELMAAEW